MPPSRPMQTPVTLRASNFTSPNRNRPRPVVRMSFIWPAPPSHRRSSSMDLRDVPDLAPSTAMLAAVFCRLEQDCG